MTDGEREQAQALANRLQLDLDVFGIYLTKFRGLPITTVMLRFGEAPLVFPPHVARRLERIYHVPDGKKEGPR